MNKAGSIGSPGWKKSVARTRRIPLCSKHAKGASDGRGFSPGRKNTADQLSGRP
jgi:hypothetical protein